LTEAAATLTRTSADLGRRYGIAKTTVRRLIRQLVNPAGIHGSALLRRLV
jgi:hypothetical protein